MPRLVRFEAIGMLKSYPIYVNPLHVRTLQAMTDEITRINWALPHEMPTDVNSGLEQAVALVDMALREP